VQVQVLPPAGVFYRFRLEQVELMYQLRRTDSGAWILQRDDGGSFVPTNSYQESLPRYVEVFDRSYKLAQAKCEFEFLLTMFRVRGLESPVVNPYDTTMRAIPRLVYHMQQVRDFETQRHLQLWLYGHIVEAAEPYETLANMLKIAKGGNFSLQNFPQHPGGRPQSPGEKISFLQDECEALGVPELVKPMKEIWNRDLRNAVFHSDYSLRGGEVLIDDGRISYSNEYVFDVFNKAIAYYDALRYVERIYRASYTYPKIVELRPGFSDDPEEKAKVIVVEGYGAVGLKSAWTLEQIIAGKIPFRVGRFTEEEKSIERQSHTCTASKEG